MIVALSVLLVGTAPAFANFPPSTDSGVYLVGFDVSRWNTHTPSMVQVSFAFARATYATREDPRFAFHMANFAKAGIVRGAFAFGVGWTDPVAQARALLSVARNADLLVLDLERDTTKSMSNAQAQVFIRTIHAAGRKIGLYHSRSGFPSLGQDYNWVAQWGVTRPSGLSWSFWQYQGFPLDRDLFRGTLAGLTKLTAGYVPLLYPRVHVTGAWWEYTAVNGHLSRRSVQTAGFSASVGPIQKAVFNGIARQLVELTAGIYAGHYVDKSDVDYLPAH